MILWTSLTRILIALSIILGAGQALSAPVANDSSIDIVVPSSGTTWIWLSSSGANTYIPMSMPGQGSLQCYSPTWTLTSAEIGVGSPYSGFQYIPTASTPGTDSFTWAASDGVITSSAATVTINFVPNTPPTAQNGRSSCPPNSPATITAAYTDPDSGQSFSASVVDDAQHGSATVVGTTFTYTPTPGYEGMDTFTYRVSDGVDDSNLATNTIQVRAGSDRAGNLVLVVVKDLLYPEISNEVVRLQQDLIDEGNTAKIIQASPSSSSALWDILKAEYDNPSQWLAGAILIGQLPGGSVGQGLTDLVYWNMKTFQTSGGIYNTDIWVSRINADNWYYGDEVTLTKRALDANHAYRKGFSRLPYTAYWYHAFSGYNYYTGRMERVWGTVTNITGTAGGGYPATGTFIAERPELVCHGATALIRGGDVMQETSHGNTMMYMQASPEFTEWYLFQYIAQLRSEICTSCSSGAWGGIVNKHLFTRGGGLMFALGFSVTAYVGDAELRDAPLGFMDRLADGETWGTAAQQCYPFVNRTYTMYYGDLSMPVKAAPSNAMPQVTPIVVDTPTNATPGQPVNLSISVTDTDGAATNGSPLGFQHQVEWFMGNYDYGNGTPAAVKTSSESGWTNLAYAFPAPGDYTVRAEVMDAWQARTWRETLVCVTGLQMRLTFDETSGTEAADSSGYGNAAVLQNDAGPWDPDGKIDGALRFDGSNDYVSTTTRYFTAPKSFTVSLWAKTTNGGGGLICFSDQQTGANGGDRTIYLDNAGKPCFAVSTWANPWIEASTPITDGKWHHLAATVSGAGTKLYVDGAVAATANWTEGRGYQTGGYWKLGGFNLWTWANCPSNIYFNGSMDDVRVYNNALSDEQILAMAGHGNHPPTPVDDNVTVEIGKSVTIQVLANDWDSDGQALALDAITAAPVHGTAITSGSSIVYTPTNITWTGVDSLLYRISDTIGAMNTATAFITVMADTTAPRLMEAWSAGNSNEAWVAFDEPVQAGTGTGGAENPANYGINCYVSVTGAVLQSDMKTVKLLTTALMTELYYVLTVSNVQDRANVPNTIMPGSQVAFQYMDIPMDMTAYWNLDETSGTAAADSSGNGHTGTLQGGAAWTTEGKQNGAVFFPGASDQILSDPVVSLASNWTISAWFTAPLPASGTWHTLTRAQNDDHHVITDSSLNLGMYDNASGGGFRTCAPAYNMGVLSDGWHHLAAVGVGSTTAFYIDGGYVGTSDRKSSTDVYAIGNYQGGGQRFSEKLDDVRIYNYSLSEELIAALGGGAMSGGSGVYTNGLPPNWQIVFFGATNAPGAAAEDDPDHDGMNNRDEYLAGTHPMDGTSVLSMSKPDNAGAGTFVIRWSSVAGKDYSILWSSNLLGEVTNAVGGLPATPPMNVFTDNVSTIVRRFYRVRVETE